MWQTQLDQLRSPDPEVRRKAIIALGRGQDPSVLPALAEVYRNDPDADLRELARKAGHYIRGQQAVPSAEPRGSAPPRNGEAYDRPVSSAAVERARGYFDRAIDFQVRGDNAKAVEMLGRALEINPALRHDSMALSLAMDLTGQGSSAAFATLSDPASRQALIQRVMGVDLVPGRRAPVVESTWGGALIDLGIYGLVNGAIVFVFSLVASDVILRMVSTFASTGSSLGAGSSQALLADLNLQQVTLPLAALYGIVSGVSAVIGLVVVQGAVHLVATSVLGGTGTLAGLIRKTTLFYTVMTAVSLVLNIGTLALGSSTDVNALTTLSVLPMVISLGMVFWAGKLTGDAYYFGTAKGCMSMALAYVGMFVFFACCAFTLSMALAPSFQTLR